MVATSSFGGKPFGHAANLDYAGLSQMAVLKPGAYRFEACVRTESVTTDQGIRFRIFDAEAPARFDLTTGQFTGTTAWTRIEQRFVVPRGTRIVQVQVVRQESMKIDNKIGGTAWIDDVKLAPGIGSRGGTHENTAGGQ